MSTWYSEHPPEAPRIGPAGYALAALRIACLGPLIFGGLGVLLAVRIVERPLHGDHRPWTPAITRSVCRGALRGMGIAHRVQGEMARGRVVMVSNHASWLDIFALNACGPLYFVSKAEVAVWPGIGWLARATGTVFISRARRDAARQQILLGHRLRMGHRLLLFPEGTSTDGHRVLPFKPTLFEVFFSQDTKNIQIQPMTVTYHAPTHQPSRFYGWWGDMSFGAHFLKVLASPHPGCVDVTCHPATPVSDHPHRKALARHCEAVVRGALEGRLERRQP